MLPYQPVAFRPAVVRLATTSPTIRRQAQPHLKSYSLGETFDNTLGFSTTVGDILRFVFHGATTWLGIHVGLKEGWTTLGVVGWILGVGNGVAGICDGISLAKRALGIHPPEGPK